MTVVPPRFSYLVCLALENFISSKKRTIKVFTFFFLLKWNIKLFVYTGPWGSAGHRISSKARYRISSKASHKINQISSRIFCPSMLTIKAKPLCPSVFDYYYKNRNPYPKFHKSQSVSGI